MARIAGNILISIGIVFVIFGYIGIFRFKDFYTRILISSKADSVGLITILAGVMILNEGGFTSFKVLIILLFTVLTNPITTHSIARSAYVSGLKIKKGKKNG